MVLWGSLSIAEALEDDGLIDEYQVIVCPVVLGAGRRMFREGTDSYEMSLRETRSFDRGVVLLSCAPAKAQSAV
jgi:dihydrofolate reductase